MRKRLIWALLVVVGALTTASAAPTATTHDFELRVRSSPASMVTGGDALIQVALPRTVPLHKATVSLNGEDVTSTLTLDPEARTLTGMVSGMDLGANRLFADSNGQGKGRPTAELTLLNHPTTGPTFSGPQQQPFVCKTQTQAGLGFPLVDNQGASACACSRRRAIPPARRSAGARTAP